MKIAIQHLTTDTKNNILVYIVDKDGKIYDQRKMFAEKSLIYQNENHTKVSIARINGNLLCLHSFDISEFIQLNRFYQRHPIPDNFIFTTTGDLIRIYGNMAKCSYWKYTISDDELDLMKNAKDLKVIRTRKTLTVFDGESDLFDMKRLKTRRGKKKTPVILDYGSSVLSLVKNGNGKYNIIASDDSGNMISTNAHTLHDVIHHVSFNGKTMKVTGTDASLFDVVEKTFTITNPDKPKITTSSRVLSDHLYRIYSNSGILITSGKNEIKYSYWKVWISPKLFEEFGRFDSGDIYVDTSVRGTCTIYNQKTKACLVIYRTYAKRVEIEDEEED